MVNRLTDQQLNCYNTFGFLSFPGLLRDRIDHITSEFEAVFVRKGGGHYGKPHNGKARQTMSEPVRRWRASTESHVM